MNQHLDHYLGGHEPRLGLGDYALVDTYSPTESDHRKQLVQGWVKQAKVKPGRGHRTENSGVEFY